MEKNQSPRTFNKIQGKTNAKLNKKEISKMASHNVIQSSTNLARKRGLRGFVESVLGFFKHIFSRKNNKVAINLGSSGSIKRTNKEAKRRSPDVRAKRNTARNSRKTNGHRGKRQGK